MSSSWRPLLQKNLKELRIHLSQTRPGSQGTREFILKEYAALKAANPTFPILVREAHDVDARAFARYAFGQERKVSLENLSEAEVASRIQSLAESRPSSTER
ncbi:ndufa2, NADH:ubiquinone oxidoreductase 10.5kD subunit [Geranomyces variabilis]|uniref:Ndufa2, NADH:ubiquinone oxidoreductase 10.5kD subunit n=1 Tax=Geranomyces variabilis TaxID=109894 RepID=A0AAD5TMB7_9FUNG|nr:thioredoxin-like protein [Geranomyces variabilis]KAJ3142964.1 ndufa2, NADH:ubiquinone oxidoreductase 10.5kD subunit [Geranomyces variabilis]KAJ3157695.1 ndufa2, NADH:ubiquinone oxidoreductase 10.5kD subunit [Geranomyces variabilis]KAJ3173577.1 ndufa2, NADH:ubiquinone oxidoreductase 10.5kD subunit [Geranomyces variabilis]KAJ3180055.1 ndufa2, NADH:ubiquinone oxidoreductase 10.5kD subunit [Geranomyces variabilis]